jgi:16S rRNA U1498 N3-methylase RsmE
VKKQKSDDKKKEINLKSAERNVMEGMKQSTTNITLPIEEGITKDKAEDHVSGGKRTSRDKRVEIGEIERTSNIGK